MPSRAARRARGTAAATTWSAVGRDRSRCADGISVIAGTGSMAYGEYAGRYGARGRLGRADRRRRLRLLDRARGHEPFLAHERRARAARPALCARAQRLGLESISTLCARIYGEGANTRGAFAQFRAARPRGRGIAGDEQARAILTRGRQRAGRRSCASGARSRFPTPPSCPSPGRGGAFSGSKQLVDIAFAKRSRRAVDLVGTALRVSSGDRRRTVRRAPRRQAWTDETLAALRTAMRRARSCRSAARARSHMHGRLDLWRMRRAQDSAGRRAPRSAATASAEDDYGRPHRQDRHARAPVRPRFPVCSMARAQAPTVFVC